MTTVFDPWCDRLMEAERRHVNRRRTPWEGKRKPTAKTQRTPSRGISNPILLALLASWRFALSLTGIALSPVAPWPVRGGRVVRVHPDRRPLIAGNWKMNAGAADAAPLAAAVASAASGMDHVDVLVAPPLIAIPAVRDVLDQAERR